MKKKKLPTIVQIAILTTITTIIWIAFDVYRALTFKPAPPLSVEIINSLDPNLDQSSLDKLQESIYLNEDEIANTEITSDSSPREEFIPKEVTTSSEATFNEATEGGFINE
jgi:hypothetical protein